MYNDVMVLLPDDQGDENNFCVAECRIVAALMSHGPGEFVGFQRYPLLPP